MRKKMFSDDYEIFDMYLLTPQAMLQSKYNVGVCGIPIQFFTLVNHIYQCIHLPSSTSVSLTQVNCPLIFRMLFTQRNRYQRPNFLIHSWCFFIYTYMKEPLKQFCEVRRWQNNAPWHSVWKFLCLYFPAMWPWLNFSSSLSLIFIICKYLSQVVMKVK